VEVLRNDVDLFPVVVLRIQELIFELLDHVIKHFDPYVDVLVLTLEVGILLAPPFEDVVKSVTESLYDLLKFF